MPPHGYFCKIHAPVDVALMHIEYYIQAWRNTSPPRCLAVGHAARTIPRRGRRLRARSPGQQRTLPHGHNPAPSGRIQSIPCKGTWKKAPAMSTRPVPTAMPRQEAIRLMMSPTLPGLACPRAALPRPPGTSTMDSGNPGRPAGYSGQTGPHARWHANPAGIGQQGESWAASCSVSQYCSVRMSSCRDQSPQATQRPRP